MSSSLTNNISRKLIEITAQFCWIFTIIGFMCMFIYETTDMKNSLAYTLFFAIFSLLCAFSFVAENEVRHTRFYKLAPLNMSIWAIIGIMLLKEAL